MAQFLSKNGPKKGRFILDNCYAILRCKINSPRLEQPASILTRNAQPTTSRSF